VVQGRAILVDTGFWSVEDAKAMQGLTCRRSSDQELSAQLARYGIGPSDVGLQRDLSHPVFRIHTRAFRLFTPRKQAAQLSSLVMQ
jgi:hypothetical protein